MALLRVDAEHRCIDRRLETQTDDIGGFFLELRIVTGNIAAQSMCWRPALAKMHVTRTWLVPTSAAILRVDQCVEPSAGLRWASRNTLASMNAFFTATPSTMPAVEATET